MRKKTRRGFIAASIRALFNRTRPDDMVELDGVERLRVASRRSHLAVSLDGEVVSAAPPLDYRIRNQGAAGHRALKAGAMEPPGPSCGSEAQIDRGQRGDTG